MVLYQNTQSDIMQMDVIQMLGGIENHKRYSTTVNWFSTLSDIHYPFFILVLCAKAWG